MGLPTIQVREITGDLLNATSGHIIHGCNAQGKMASGVAKVLRDRFPGIYQTYKHIEESHGLEVGMAMATVVSDDLVVWNLITQRNYGYDGELYFMYEGFEVCLRNMVNTIMQVPELSAMDRVVHTPLIGCGLAGAEWGRVKPILVDNLVPNFEVNIYRLGEPNAL